MKKIGIIEDDLEFANLLSTAISQHEEFYVAYNFDTVNKFLVQCKEPPELIILDIGLPEMSGVDGIIKIKEKFPDSDIVMLTLNTSEEMVFTAFQRGAIGYLLKNETIENIMKSIMITIEGGSTISPEVSRKIVNYFSGPKEKMRCLTDREMEITKKISDGLAYKQIAYKLDISIHTVRTHCRNIFEKLAVNNKAELIAKTYPSFRDEKEN